MKCFDHPQADAVGYCTSCSKGLCTACAIDTGSGLACSACEAKVRGAEKASRAAKTLPFFLPGGVFLVFGILEYNPRTKVVDYFLITLGTVFIAIAFFNYYVGARRPPAKPK